MQFRTYSAPVPHPVRNAQGYGSKGISIQLRTFRT